MTEPERARIRHAMSDDQLKLVLAFAREAENLRHLPAFGMDDKGTVLEVTNTYVPSKQPGARSELRGRTVMSSSDVMLANPMLKLRLFVLKDEPTYFMRIRNIVGRAFHDAGVSDTSGHIEASKDAWKFPLPSFESSGEDLLDLWFNGEIFHRDEAKKVRLTALRAQHGDPTIRAWLVIAFGMAQATVLSLHKFLRDRTDLYEGVDFRIDPT